MDSKDLKKSVNLDEKQNICKIARYINVVIKNTQKIDQVKAILFNQQFSLNQLFNQIDTNKKGYIAQDDIIHLIQKNGADKKAFEMQKIFRYFGSLNNQITKSQFLKAVVLPSWKMNNDSKSQSNSSKTLFKFLVSLYIAIQQYDAERNKLKQIDMELAFQIIAKGKKIIGIQQLRNLLVNEKMEKPDPFELLNFMHNRLTINCSEFVELFSSSFPQKFEEINKSMNKIVKSGCVTNLRQQQKDNQSNRTVATSRETVKVRIDCNIQKNLFYEKNVYRSNIFESFSNSNTQGLMLQNLLKRNNFRRTNVSFYQ